MAGEGGGGKNKFFREQKIKVRSQKSCSRFNISTSTQHPKISTKALILPEIWPLGIFEFFFSGAKK